MEFGHLDWLEADPLAELAQIRTEVVAAGREIFDLSMINPDLPPPRVLVDRLMEATLKPDNHRYSVARGIRKLRDAFAFKYRTKFSAALDPEREVCVTFGTKDALQVLFRAVGVGGARVLLGKPAYPAYTSALKIAGAEPSFFEIVADEERMLAEIETQLRGSYFRILLLNFPNNPTGTLVSAEFYRRVLAIAAECGVLVANDFVYGEMAHDEGTHAQPVSLLALPEAKNNAVEIYSLSKAYGVPGWRVGALLGNAQLIQAVSRLKTHLDYGLFLPTQLAAASALQSRDALVAPALDHYRLRVQLFSAALRRSGWEVPQVGAGVSVWARPPAHGRLQGTELAKELLKRHAIVTMPGRVFGADYSEWLRFAMVVAEGRLGEVVERLDDLVPPRLFSAAAANLQQPEAATGSRS